MRLQEMLSTHPRKPPVEISAISDAVRRIYECADANIACADACLGEDMVQNLVRCIRLNQDCADICEVTGKLLSRQTEGDSSSIRAQLQACIAANRACAAECDKHAPMHEHCRICGEACRDSEEVCRNLLDKFPSGGAGQA
ncbi:MAG: four-helix bundle copper-binding protein [Desulfuromonadales bacterium]